MSARLSTQRVIKDGLSYLGGWGLILHQALVVPSQDFNLWFLLVGGGLVGVPGFTQLLALRAGTALSPSLSPEQESPSPPPSSSNTSEVGRDR